ncbi:MAG: heavy-metal-associated domain-containing protein [Flavobacteriaceae bacterium]|jgi:copper chaperone CopZ|nr:heavy-metal-associated domain-containing protein [Flavobacteriaceae bacterium]
MKTGLLLVLAVFLSIGLNAQIKNPKVEKVKISGNCGMCKETIEKTGTIENASQVVWDKDTKIATITYDEEKISLNDILKKIAKSGYSSEKYKAKKSDYNRLPICCHY